MKKSVSLAFLFATLSFLSCLIALAIYAVSIEVERFDRQADRLESIKNYVVTMGLLTQSNIDTSEKKDRKNIIQSTQRSFDEYIYAIDGSELDYYEAVAYKTMHETRNYFLSLFNNKNSVFYYRSYSGKKYLLDRKVNGFKVDARKFSENWCKTQFVCTQYAWPDQLLDRAVVSTIYHDSDMGENLISVASPVYSNEEENDIVGEYVFSLFFDLNGRSVETIYDQGFKTTLLTYSGYPFARFAYTKTYIADNKTIFLFSYPLSKLVIDYSYLFFVFLLLFFVYFNLYEQSKTRKQQLAEVSSEVIKDELTGLHNRKIFNDTLFKDTLEDSQYTVIAIDGDGFKNINDTFGHHVGDEVICQVGNSMKATFRRGDFLVRTGGDEFLAILPDCDHKKASELVEKLKQYLKNSTLPYKDLTIAVSAGIATRAQGETLQEMMMQADEALYKVKSSRR
ncbi:GGDEF domain-containing protein [Vibrio vulnificus]|uniref:GGDEF domain-containing protein n=1 Tax=Vibrio vulnificus TaxID=672 RepID=UPI001CDB53BA|nr:GGDEF domain-containing protein [Vibrio vulnificus]MCA3951038.1 GGDEF domain-containing protein [Vibrio vulnificus]